MSKRLEILQGSLIKKEQKLNDLFDNHFATVQQANGQPLNDKGAKGRVALRKWERQSDQICNQQAEIEKTKNAIEREKWKISGTENAYNAMPGYITELIDTGTLKQWRKFPHIMFVDGVEKARIYFNKESGEISHKYTSSIPDKKQYAIFRDVYNGLNNKQKDVKK